MVQLKPCGVLCGDPRFDSIKASGLLAVLISIHWVESMPGADPEFEKKGGGALW